MMTEALGGEIQVDPNGYLFNSHTMDWTFKHFGGPIQAVGWDPADVLYPGKTWNPQKGWM
jgi:hypothetical protein